MSRDIGNRRSGEQRRPIEGGPHQFGMPGRVAREYAPAADEPRPIAQYRQAMYRPSDPIGRDAGIGVVVAVGQRNDLDLDHGWCPSARNGQRSANLQRRNHKPLERRHQA
jgi:hypothetical protein